MTPALQYCISTSQLFLSETLEGMTFFANIQNTPGFFPPPRVQIFFADIWEVGRAAGEASFFSFFCEADLCLGEIFTVVSLSVRPSRAFVCMEMELKVEVWKSQKKHVNVL